MVLTEGQKQAIEKLDAEMEEFEVKFIIRKGGSTKVRYTVKPTDAEPEESIVSRADVLHEDFRRLWALLPGVARRMLEFPAKMKMICLCICG